MFNLLKGKLSVVRGTLCFQIRDALLYINRGLLIRNVLIFSLKQGSEDAALSAKCSWLRSHSCYHGLIKAYQGTPFLSHQPAVGYSTNLGTFPNCSTLAATQ